MHLSSSAFLFTLLTKIIIFLHFFNKGCTFLLFKIYLFYGCGCCFMCRSFHVCLCTVYVPDALRGRKRVLDHLRLEIKSLVSLHMSAGNWTKILWMIRGAFNYPAISPTPYFLKNYLFTIFLFIDFISTFFNLKNCITYFNYVVSHPSCLLVPSIFVPIFHMLSVSLLSHCQKKKRQTMK